MSMEISHPEVLPTTCGGKKKKKKKELRPAKWWDAQMAASLSTVWEVSAPEATSTYVWWEAAKTQGNFTLHSHYLIVLENFSGNLLRLSWGSKGNSHMGIYIPIWGSLLALSLTYFSTNYSCYRNSWPYLNKQIIVYYFPNTVKLCKVSYGHSLFYLFYFLFL